MHIITMSTLVGRHAFNVRRFCDWPRLFSGCELSKEVSNVLSNASTIAKNAGSGTVESEFVLKSLLTSGLLRGKVSHCIPLNTDSLMRELDGYIRKQKYSNGDNRIGPSTSSALLYAQSLALSSNKSVGPSELVEGLVKYDAFLQSVKNKRSHTESAKEPINIDEYFIDLTEKARRGCLGPFIGREAELERLKSTLGRMRKSNVLIVGAAGVGKTALVERLALDLLDEDDPHTLLKLDLCGFYSGQGTRGELETKLRAIFDRITGGNTILFIDEIHHLIQNQDGGLNVTNLFKPIMTSGEVKIIGSTTVKEYHQYFRLDRAFERRFEVLRLPENTLDESLVILHGVRSELEVHHNVEITNDALLAAANITRRFIPRRTLPDKALDVLDEAAMLVRQKAASHRREQEELTRRKNRLIVDMIHSGDADATKRAAIADIEARESEMRASRAAQRELHRKLRDLQQLQHDYEKSGNLLKASELHNHTIPEVLRSLERLQSDSANIIDDGTAGNNRVGMSPVPKEGIHVKVINRMEHNNNNNDIRACGIDYKSGQLKVGRVDKFTVAEVVSRQTGIPVEVMLQSPVHNYQKTLDELKAIVSGQDYAVENTVLHFYRHSCGLTGTNRAAAALCFIGSPGVGRHMLLRRLSGMLGLGLKHISCSQLHTPNSTNILVGSPPGYVGYREGGILSEWVKESPYSIVMFDDAHMMHVNVANLLVSAINTGSLIDNQGEEHRVDQCFFVFMYPDEKSVHPIVKDHADDIIKFNKTNKQTLRMKIKSKLSEMPLVNLRYTEAALERICTLSEDTESVLKLLDHTVSRLIVCGNLSKSVTCKLLLRSETTSADSIIPVTDDLVIVSDHAA